jgi:hypothetical protein
MGEAELSADLFVSLIDSVKTNKGIETYYKKYEEEENGLPEAEEKFDTIMSYIGEIYPSEEIKNTNWKRVQLFYTLFTSIGHSLYGLGGLDEVDKPNINKKNIGRVRVVLDEISSKYDEYTEEKDAFVPVDYKEFISYSRRGTTDTGARISRTKFVCEKLSENL